jgi:hypothetical protein
MLSLAKQIRIAKAEVEVTAGEKPKHISLTELEDEKNKGQQKKGGDQSKMYK